MAAATPTIEFGTFLVFVIVPFLVLLAVHALRGWGWPGKFIAGSFGVLGFILLGAIALMMFSGYNVVMTKTVNGYTEVIPTYNGTTGRLITNQSVIIPAYTQQTNVINSDQYVFGWIFYGIAIMYGLIMLKLLMMP